MDDKVTYFIAGAMFAVTLLRVSANLLKVLAEVLKNNASGKRKK